MSFILCIETATEVCSVAIAKDGQCVHVESIHGGNQHSRKLTHLISRTLEQLDIIPRDLAAIAVSDGPGSYTGLRVGASVAKGFCYSLNIPLIAVSTLGSLASSIDVEADPHCTLPMIDARRMEVYTAVFSPQLQVLKETFSLVLTELELQKLVQEFGHLTICGNGTSKCRDAFPLMKGIDYLQNECSAEYLCSLAYKKWSMREFENPAYYAPFYFKAPHITQSSKRIF